MLLIFATQLTAAATMVLAVFAITAFLAYRAFRMQPGCSQRGRGPALEGTAAYDSGCE